MKIIYQKNGDSGFFFKTPVELKLFFSMFSFAMKYWFGTSNNDMNKAFAEVEKDTYQQLRTEDEMSHIHTCKKCKMFIDDRKDRFHHQEFESGYEEWQHIPDCPNLKEFK